MMRLETGRGAPARGPERRARAPAVLISCWIALGLAGLGAAARAGESAAASPAPHAQTQSDVPGVQEVEVTGERPGPSLWRVSKGDHVLWLLGTLDPLPKHMTWRSREVESVLAHADEVLAGNPDVSANVGPISIVRLYLQWRRTQKIPEKAQLRDWLSPALYARFSAVKARFDPHDHAIENLRPLFAARRLYDRAIDASQLTSRNDIQDEVLRLARRHRVPIERTAVRLTDPRGILNEVGEIPRAAEIGCLDATVERLETDLEAMKARARAWSLGDVDALRALPYPKQRQICTSAAATSPQIKALMDQAARDWQAALEKALATRRTTLAMKPIYDLIAPNGILDRLRAEGYTVEGP
jgi:uncharacterized protein YbaP (TraB family)